mmetsp:Transcript_62295/g.131706  ORF Transcript_62295/g.131706 Transcript_62295/m.131706 type:complete len:471 (-) Transcript_62295:378-1790(-)
MKFKVCSRPSSSTTVPEAPILPTASAAKRTTSPCVSFATAGMFFETRLSLRRVFATSETLQSRPRPLILMSNEPSNSANSNMFDQSPRFSGVSTAVSKPSKPCCSQKVTANKVKARKQFPFDHVAAFDNLLFILSTVVPLPVPLSPTKITTQPSPSGKKARISSATWSADFPITSIERYSGAARSVGRTPFPIACCTPSANFRPSSSSLERISPSSCAENCSKVGSAAKVWMIADDVRSSWANSNSLLIPIGLWLDDEEGEGGDTCSAASVILGIASSSCCHSSFEAAVDTVVSSTTLAMPGSAACVAFIAISQMTRSWSMPCMSCSRKPKPSTPTSDFAFRAFSPETANQQSNDVASFITASFGCSEKPFNFPGTAKDGTAAELTSGPSQAGGSNFCLTLLRGAIAGKAGTFARGGPSGTTRRTTSSTSLSVHQLKALLKSKVTLATVEPAASLASELGSKVPLKVRPR